MNRNHQSIAWNQSTKIRKCVLRIFRYSSSGQKAHLVVSRQEYALTRADLLQSQPRLAIGRKIAVVGLLLHELQMLFDYKSFKQHEVRVHLVCQVGCASQIDTLLHVPVSDKREGWHVGFGDNLRVHLTNGRKDPVVDRDASTFQLLADFFAELLCLTFTHCVCFGNDGHYGHL